MNRDTVKEILRVINQRISDELEGKAQKDALRIEGLTQSQNNIAERYFEQSMKARGEPMAKQNVYYEFLRDLSVAA
jgi:hypothetical protein